VRMFGSTLMSWWPMIFLALVLLGYSRESLDRMLRYSIAVGYPFFFFFLQVLLGFFLYFYFFNRGYMWYGYKRGQSSNVANISRIWVQERGFMQGVHDQSVVSGTWVHAG
jgi:hypothetical protein